MAQTPKNVVETWKTGVDVNVNDLASSKPVPEENKAKKAPAKKADDK